MSSMAEVSSQPMDKSSGINIEGSRATTDSLDATNNTTNEEQEGNDTFEVRKRTKTSPVWNEYKTISLPDNTKKAECIHCGAKMSLAKSSSTSHLARHLKSCLKIKFVGV